MANTAIVKEVPSGDCVILMGTSGSPPPQRQLNLAGLDAPRIGFRDRADEPYAFQSREFLRKMLIGKTVQFKVDYEGASRPPPPLLAAAERLSCNCLCCCCS